MAAARGTCWSGVFRCCGRPREIFKSGQTGNTRVAAAEHLRWRARERSTSKNRAQWEPEQSTFHSFIQISPGNQRRHATGRHNSSIIPTQYRTQRAAFWLLPLLGDRRAPFYGRFLPQPVFMTPAERTLAMTAQQVQKLEFSPSRGLSSPQLFAYPSFFSWCRK